MGFKSRLIITTEEYFIMEINDLHVAHYNFCMQNNREPKIIIINEKHRDELISEFTRQFHSLNFNNGDLFFMGIKIITSVDVDENKVEIY